MVTKTQRKHQLALCKALESGKYKQAKNKLRGRDSFCCLGVACEISGLGRWEAKKARAAYITEEGSQAEVLPSDVREYYGFYSNSGALSRAVNFKNHIVHCLSGLNDKGMPFNEISELIRKKRVR